MPFFGNNTGGVTAPVTVTSFNGRTGDVVLTSEDVGEVAVTKEDIGLGNVDNTSDLAKPISTAAQAALDLKAPLINFRGALVYNSSGGVGADVTWANESYDTDNIHSTSTNTNRLVVPAGVTRVRLKGQAVIQLAAGAQGGLIILKNGSGGYIGGGSTTAENNFVGTTATYTKQVRTPTLTVTAGDYFTLYMTGNVGAPPDATGAATWFAMEIIE